ncbi:MAG TPA: hypothetical protein ENI34_02445 [candidate division WOR-3 bacterium]|uniref:Polyamine aminopropyltransferase n=1 Tax=candidate division WOR-3 bacterium TaxID=2052148 RepID=A0A9C9ELH3_UNCW3|nr:hypothetical protein [candidate division WOR-3 bacterium]
MGRIRTAIFSSGVVMVIGQTIMIREALVLFGGYELVSGVLLCFWLLWGGLGSFIFSKIRLKHQSVNVYASLLILLALSLIFSITFMRFALKLFSLPFGEVIGLEKILEISFLSLAPTCIIFGALYPAASRILEPAKVYLLEGLGAFLGGLLLTFILLLFLPPYAIILIAVVLLGVCACIVTAKPGLLVFPFLLLFLFIKIPAFELTMRRVQMPGQNLLAVKESKYGMIAVTRTENQLNFYTNGVFDFTYPDLYTSEEAVHYSLLLHPAPQKVLLVGGGIGNCIKQIFKHPDVREVTYLELDPLFFKMGEEYIRERLTSVPGLKVIFGDARFFIKNTTDRYDVIIINLPDPINAQLNRFYTKEFFFEIRRILEPDGILSIKITAPPDIVSPLFGQLLNTIHRTLGCSYRYKVCLPAARMTFIASNHHPIDTDGLARLLNQRIQERHLDLKYVNEYFFLYNLTSEKLNYLKRRIQESRGVINTDLKPVCYYFTTILWGGVVSGGLRNLFIRLFALSPWWFFVPLILIFVFFRHKSMVYISVFSMGASEISAEVILIILFQTSYGYLYGWIGGIIAFYMLGLALGTILYLRSPFKKGNLVILLSYVEFITALYFITIIGISLVKIPGTNLLISVLIFIGGVLGGIHFPLSIDILKKRAAGILYGVDLIGSGLGALITAIIFIPILGIVFTLFIFTVLNILIAVGLRTV